MENTLSDNKGIEPSIAGLVALHRYDQTGTFGMEHQFNSSPEQKIKGKFSIFLHKRIHVCCDFH